MIIVAQCQVTILPCVNLLACYTDCLVASVKRSCQLRDKHWLFVKVVVLQIFSLLSGTVDIGTMKMSTMFLVQMTLEVKSSRQDGYFDNVFFATNEVKFVGSKMLPVLFFFKNHP